MVPDQFKLPPNRANLPATLLFLPGTLCDERMWEAQFLALSKDWPCTFVDYRFEESIFAMAMTALAQVSGPLIPIGLSMGGMVALEIWHQAPERVSALALFDTDPGADTPERCRNRDAQVLAATHGGFRSMVETQLAPAYTSPRNSAGTTAGAVLRQKVIEMALDQGVAAFAAQVTALATRQDNWPLLGGIGVPTLVACGADDQLCLPEWHRRMAAIIPASTFESIEAAGHLSCLEQPDATTRLLQSWLEGLRSL